MRLISDLTADFGIAAKRLCDLTSVEATLTRVVELAVATIDDCELAGIFLLEGDVATIPVHTDPIVADIDASQRHYGEGPCFDAITHGVPFYADDLTTEARWPRFAPEAVGMGIRSLLALPLVTEATLGALNLYARHPAAFDLLDHAKGMMLASLAGVVITAASSHEEQECRVENLHAALTTRDVIGQAQGVLMERERISADRAFDTLRRMSQHANRKLLDVARDIVATTERSGGGQPHSMS